MAADRKSDLRGADGGRALVKARPSRGQGARSKSSSGDPTRQTTVHLTEAILLAAEQSGEDCQGKDGLVGYLRRIANEDIKTFSGFLAKVLPLQVAGDPESPLRVVVATGIERAPDGRAAGEAGQETVRTERRDSVSK